MDIFENKKLIQLFWLIILIFFYNKSIYAQRYFEFGCRDLDSTENFIVATTDSLQITIADSLLLLPDSLRGGMIYGFVTHGNDGYNYNWDWHFIPNQWQIVETAVELCETTPSAISEYLCYQDTLRLCPVCTITQEVFPLSIRDENKNSSEQNIKIYPNPNQGIFSVIIPARRCENFTLKVFNILGQLLYIKPISTAGIKNVQFDISNFSNGIYFIQLTLGTQIVVKKIIKR